MLKEADFCVNCSRFSRILGTIKWLIRIWSAGESFSVVGHLVQSLPEPFWIRYQSLI